MNQERTSTAEIVLQQSDSALVLDATNGSITTFLSHGVILIPRSLQQRPLFRLRFRDTDGFPREISSLDLVFKCLSLTLDKVVLSYHGDTESGLSICIKVDSDKDKRFLWHLSLSHTFPGYLEWIEFPIVVVPGDFIRQGGQGTLFWPAVEGILVESLSQRDLTHSSYRPIEYPNHGWAGYYPGCAQMQFMAYFRQNRGLYLASHDAFCTTKEIEYAAEGDDVRMIFKLYPGARGQGEYQVPFPMVMQAFEGGWQEAAEIYRAWVEGSDLPLPSRLADRADREPWLEKSPVIVTYPVTGEGHHAGPTQPNEFFPFTNALPVIKNIGQKLDSSILTLLMHWEGTAPWAPPYVWPPRGGKENLQAFATGLHEMGHYLGLYCSGLAWTNTAVTGDGNYDRTKELKRDDLLRHMCRGPLGEYESKICNCDELRWGYDICVKTDFAETVIAQEALNMASAGVDYIQLFDQNLGGASYQCHDPRHGHPPAPGPWQTDAMRNFLGRIKDKLVKAGYDHVRLGCEAAAAEPYIEHLPLNDLRFFIGFSYGRPVPAFAYVFHEYTTNFMGNQCLVMETIDGKKSPNNLALRLAYSFCAGDLLTVVLKNGGDIHWAWCEKWDVDPPDQEKHWKFIRHLNKWRQGAGKLFLYFGRMIKSQELEGLFEVPLHLTSGEVIQYPSVLTSSWRSKDGEVGHFFVNYLDSRQEVTLDFDCFILRNPGEREAGQILPARSTIDVPPMTAVLALSKSCRNEAQTLKEFVH